MCNMTYSNLIFIIPHWSTLDVCLYVYVCVCVEWRVVTGTDYVSVILFITVGAPGVSVAGSMIYIRLL